MHSLQQQQQQHLLRKSTVRFAKLFRWALSFHCHSRQCARATRLQPRLVPQHAVTMAATAGVGAGSTDTSSQISGSAALGSEELTEVKVGLAAPICDLPPHSPSCAQRVWALVDTDGSGSIDSTELRGMDVAHSVWCLEGAGGCHTLRLADASSDQA